MPSITPGMNYPIIKLNKYALHSLLHQRLSVIYAIRISMPCHELSYEHIRKL